jgi:hypothetical protein
MSIIDKVVAAVTSSDHHRSAGAKGLIGFIGLSGSIAVSPAIKARRALRRPPGRQVSPR